MNEPQKVGEVAKRGQPRRQFSDRRIEEARKARVGARGLTRDLFVQLMSRLAIETRSELTNESYMAFWARVMDWHPETFEAAVETCGAEMNRMPTIADLRAARPVQNGQVVEQIRKEEAAVSIWRIPDTNREMDDRISAMTRRELMDVMIWLGNTQPAAEWNVANFLRNPNSKIYRDIIRDYLKQMDAKQEKAAALQQRDEAAGWI